MHSAHGGRKAHPDFELKDRRPPTAAARRAVIDFKIRMGSGWPCDEWIEAAGSAVLATKRHLAMS
jgi:hypothetical protein